MVPGSRMPDGSAEAMCALSFSSYIAGSVGPEDGEAEIREPATGALLARGRFGGHGEVDHAVAAARDALGAWGSTGTGLRSAVLHRIADALESEGEDLARLEARNVGKVVAAVADEIEEAVGVLRYFASVAGAGTGLARRIDDTSFGYTLKGPVGVCAQIVPWNYPLLMAVWKIAPALAAGCTIVLEPDPKTPLSALRLVAIAEAAGLAPGVLNVVPAEGPVVGAHLVAHPGVDKVAFTGSTATGSEVMRLAAPGVKRLTLELGGKGPNLLFDSAALDDAIPSSAWAIFTSAGQSCEARSRLLVQRSIYEETVERLAVATAEIVVGDPLDPVSQVGSLISAEHRERVHGFVAGGVRDGARLVSGGRVPDGPGAFYPLTVMADVDPRSSLGQEEVFGPVVAVIPFDDEAHAIAIANDVRYGLFGTVWTQDVQQAHRVAHQLEVGGVGINTPWTATAGLPFGGLKQSGLGRELSASSLDSYLEERSVLVATEGPFDPFGVGAQRPSDPGG